MAEGQQKEESSGRVVMIVALCAAVAVAAIVGGTLLLSRHESTSLPGRPGTPLIKFEVAPSTPLGRAAKLLDSNDAAGAAAIFRQYATPEAKLGLAFAEWTGPSSLGSVTAIAAASPANPAVQFNLGLAYFQAGQDADATKTWQETASRFPDSPYAIDALDALTPGIAAGLPLILADPAAVPTKARAAFVAGVNLWNSKRVVSARKMLDTAARLAPNSPEALVGAAVALFSPADSIAPFPKLGPLTATFPHAAVVRLNLGELLLWRRELAKAKVQLGLAAAEEPKSLYAKYARAFLESLGHK